MDKQLLDGLDNLSEALIMIAEALEKKNTNSNSATANALVSGDFTTQIKEINVSIKSIQKDTKKILENQQTILEMSKKKDKKSSLVEDVGGDEKAESNLKKGVTTILLIAVGVLAIGLAFKLIGNIDFLSVVGLSLAIVLVAVAFEKVAKLGLSTKEAFNTSLILVMMAFAITISSWVLKMLTPISFSQLLTAIFIAGMFATLSKYLENIFIAAVVFKKLNVSPFELLKTLVSISLAITASSWILSFIKPLTLPQSLTGILISAMFAVVAFNMDKIAEGVVAFKLTGVKPQDLLLVLVGIAAAITASSWILSLINPLTLPQAITAILISAMFAIVAFNMDKIAEGVVAFKLTGVKPQDLLLVLVGIAAAITASSWILSLVQPIGLWQFVTVIGIAIMFAIMSYFMEDLAIGIAVISQFVGESKIYLIPLVLVGIALAIMLSSKILAETADIKFMTLLKIVILSLVLAISTLALMPAILIFGKMPLKDLAAGLLSVVLIAGAIMISSHILSLGKYDKYPDWKWSLGVGLSMLAFGTTALLMGAIILETGGLGLAAVALGAVAILLVAATITAASLILGKGKYENYPGFLWSMGVGLSMLGFGTSMIALGTIILLSGGLGLAAVTLGGVAVLLVASTIVATSFILSKGKYDKYPTLDWSLGVGLSMTGFGMAMGLLGTFILGSLGLGMVALMAGKEAVLMIAETIVESSFILQKGTYTGGPTKKWSEGISLALGAFAPVYKMLSSGGIMDVLFGSGPSPKQFSEGIITVSKGIVDAANYFAGVKVAFSGGPSKKWAEGVGTAIAAFAPVYEALSSGGFFSTKVSPEDMKSGILTIADGIITAALKFSDNITLFDITKVPSKTWGESVGGALQAFAPIFTYMSENSGWFTSGKEAAGDMVYGINSVAQAIITVAKRFASVKENIWDSYPKKEWINSIKSTITSFIGIVKSLEDTDWIELNSVSRIARKIVETASILSKGKFDQVIDPNFIKSLSRNVIGFAVLAKKLGEINEEDGLLKTAFGLDPVSRTANSMVKLANAYDKMANALKKFGGALASIDGQKVDVIRRLTGNMAVLAAMNEQAFASMMTTLESKGSVFAKLIDTDKTKTGPVVGEGKGKKGPMDLKTKPKSKYGETYQQLDIMIDLLNNINRNTSQLDEFLDKQGFKTGELEDLTMKKEK